MSEKKISPWVVLKLQDDSEWQGRLPVPVERYMAGMADEIKRLRAENERLRAENKRLRAENKRLRGLLGRGAQESMNNALRYMHDDNDRAALDAAGGAE